MASKNTVERLAKIEKNVQDVATRINQDFERTQTHAKATTESLYNLRSSTVTSFDNVTRDMQTLLRTTQRLNERIGQLESQNLALATEVRLLRDRSTFVEQFRVQLKKAIENS